MTISIFDLPRDGDGGLPAGRWRVCLEGGHTDGLGGVMFVDGVSMSAVDGHALKRICVNIPVLGILRVDGGDACVMGDVTRIKAAMGIGETRVAEKQKAPVLVTEPDPEPAPPQMEPGASELPTPTSFEELNALDEDTLRALSVELDVADRRLGAEKLKARIAEKLGLDD